MTISNNDFFTAPEVQGGIDWSAAIVTANGTTAAAGKGYRLNSSGSAFTITLPATPVEGDEIWFHDTAGSAETNNITIARNGKKIMNATDDLDLTFNNQTVGMIFTGDTFGWKVHAGSHLGGVTVVNGLIDLHTVAAAAASHTPDFSADKRVYETTVTGNTAINPVVLPAGQAGSFKIFLKVDNTGGYSVTLPGTGDKWFAGPSGAIPAAANTMYIIQADFTSTGDVYYDVSSYATS